MQPFYQSMPWAIVSAFAVVSLVIWTSGVGGPTRAVQEPLIGSGPPNAGGPAATKPHYAAPWQLVESNVMVGRLVDDLQALADDGRRMNWAQLSSGQPVVLVFVKDGCPCNIEFEPYFHRVAQVYAGTVRFAGVIDADLDAARRYAAEQHVPYPVLADADQRIIRRFGAKNGCYVSLLTPDGVIDGYWPGISADALEDLGRRIAGLTRGEEHVLDVTGLPKALTSGCHFAT